MRILNGLFGRTSKDTEVAPAKTVGEACRSIVVHRRGNYKSCFIDKSGQIAIEVPNPYGGYSFSEGMCVIGGSGAAARYGFMNKSGELVVSPTYFSALSFHEGLAAVATDCNEWGFIDKTGRIVIETKYGQAERFREGLAAVRFNGPWGFVDRKGKTVIPPIGSWRETPFFSEGLALVKRNDKWGYIDKKGQDVIKPRYDAAQAFLEGLAGAKQGDLWGFINAQGQWVIKPAFGRVYGFAESIAFVWPIHSGGIKGIDHEGKVVIDFAEWAERGDPVEDIGFFKEGVASVRVNGKWGFIDKQGRVVVPVEFERPASFSEGLAAVEKEGRYCYIDKKGNVMIETDAFCAHNFSEGLAPLDYL